MNPAASGNERERHEAVRDDAVAVEPRVLRADRREAADREQDDGGAQPREAAAHRRLELFLIVLKSVRVNFSIRCN